jgi:hypothetical protein
VFYSDYFRAAFNGSFAEAKKKNMRLVDVDQETFEDFHTWLYTRKLAHEDDEPLNAKHLTNLWAFGDYFQMPMLQNCVMDEIFASIYREDKIPHAIAKFAYGKTVEGSLLRKASIEILAYHARLDDDDHDSMLGDRYRQSFTFDILHDLVRELAAARENEVPHGEVPQRDKCFFHVHGKDEHC